MTVNGREEQPVWPPSASIGADL